MQTILEMNACTSCMTNVQKLKWVYLNRNGHKCQMDVKSILKWKNKMAASMSQSLPVYLNADNAFNEFSNKDF